MRNKIAQNGETIPERREKAPGVNRHAGARHDCGRRPGLGSLCSARTLRAASTIVSRPSPRPQEWGRCKQEGSRHMIAVSLRTRYARMLRAGQRDSRTEYIGVAHPRHASQDRRIAVWLILIGVWNSEAETPNNMPQSPWQGGWAPLARKPMTFASTLQSAEERIVAA